MTLEEKRLMLRDKIDASRHRLADYVPPEPSTDLQPITGAADSSDSSSENAALDFVKKYPIAVVGGAVAVGLLIGSRGKKAAVTAAKKPAKKPNIIATMLIDAAIGYGLKMIDKSRTQETQALDKDVA
ncbi:MAG: hypothetical protein ABJP34_09340 [Erythrobacter sp.]